MRSGASMGQLKMWGSETGVSWAQWLQYNGKIWEQMCEWVRRVWPMRKRVRMISRRRDGWLDDGHGTVKGLSLAKCLCCCCLLDCSCHLLFITCVMKKERSVFVARRSGFIHWSEDAAFATLSTLSFPGIPKWEELRRVRLGNFFLRMYSVEDEFGKQGGDPSWYSRWPWVLPGSPKR